MGFLDFLKKREQRKQAQGVKMPTLQAPQTIQLDTPAVAEPPADTDKPAVQRAWEAGNPQEDKETQVQEPPASTAVDIYTRLNAHKAPMSEEDKAKEERRAKARHTVGRVADILTGLSNIYHATKGAPPQTQTSMAQEVQRRYDEAVAKRDAQEDAYNRGMMEAHARDEVSRLTRAKMQAEQMKAEQKAVADEWERAWKISQAEEKKAQQAAKDAETKRHNKESEAVAQSKAKAYERYMDSRAKYYDGGGDKTDEPFRLDDGSMIYIPQKAYANKVAEFYDMIIKGLPEGARHEMGLLPGFQPTKTQQEMIVKQLWRTNPEVVREMISMSRGAEADPWEQYVMRDDDEDIEIR